MSSIEFPENARKIFDMVGSMSGVKFGPQCCAATVISSVLALALLIIGCQSASYSSAGIGYTTIGVAGGMFLADLGIGNLKERKIQILLSAFIAAAFITFGALGASSILTANQVGWGILGTCAGNFLGGCAIASKKLADFL